MGASLKVMKYTFIISSCFLVVTFVTFLNSQYQWIKSEWLSNFLSAIFSGVFASTLVVFICEIQKYSLSKKQAEDGLYNCCVEMIARFLSAKTMLMGFVAEQDKIMPTDLLEDLREDVHHQLDIYFCIDYTTLSKKNSLFVARQVFNNFIIDTLNKTLSDCMYLDIAINEVKIKNLQNRISESHVTTGDERLLSVIKVLVEKFEYCIDAMVDFVEKVDYTGRFHFKDRFQSAKQSQVNCGDESIEDFLQRNA